MRIPFHQLLFHFFFKLTWDKIPIIAQSYDGASVMSGSRGGVQKKLKYYYPYAAYIHCMAHKLNLVTLDMCENIKGSYFTFIFIVICIYIVIFNNKITVFYNLITINNITI